jgi:hypothetical protein
LRVLNRNLKDVIIVDNAVYAFASQLENGYPIILFYDNIKDQEMENLTSYLLSIKDMTDVRVECIKKFKLAQLVESDIGKYLKYYVANNSDLSDQSEELSKEPQKVDGEIPQVNANIKKSLDKFQNDMDNCFGKKN